MMQQKKLLDVLMMTVSVLAISTFCDLPAVEAQEAVEDLGTIVVKTGEGTAEADSDFTLDGDALTALNAPNMQALFSSTPAITVTSGPNASQQFYLHGLDQTKANIVVDGARQRSGIWHHVAGDIGIEPEFLKRVDVKSGLSPADAGPGALAGTISFETKDVDDLLEPGKKMGARVSTGFRSNGNVFDVSAAGFGKHEGFEMLGIIKHTKGDDYKDGGGATERGTDPNTWNGLGKLAYEAGEGHRFEISAEHYYDHGLRQLRANMNFDPGPNIYFNDHTQRRTTASIKYTTTKPTDFYNPELQLYVNHVEIQRPYGAYYDFRIGNYYNGDFNSDMTEIGGKVLNTFTFDMGTVTAGLDFYNNKIDLDRFYFNDSVDEEVTNLGGLVQARFKPIERLEVSAGLRIDHQTYKAVDGQSFDNTGLSPNILAELELIDGLKAKAGASSIFGGLEASEMAIYGAGNYTYDPNVKPARSNTVEGGLSFNKNGWTLEGTIFSTTIENPIVNASRSGPRTHGDDLKSTGIDLSARYDWDHAYIAAAFSHVDVEWGDNTSGRVNNTFAEVGDMLTLQGAYTFDTYNLTIGALASIAFELDDEFGTEAERKGYQAVDLFAEYKPELLENFTLRTEITNLLDQEYVARGSHFGGYHPFFSVNYEPTHAPGRSFNIRASKTF